MKKPLVPIFQPVVDLDAGRVLYLEALARHVNGGDLHGKVLEAAEFYGIVHHIDLCMMEQVLRAVESNPSLRVGVNVSVMTIENALGDLLSLLFRFIECADRVVLEITESVMVADFGAIERFVDAAHIAGSKVAVDDLWDGYATFELVQRIKPDYVKTAGGVMGDLMASQNPRWMATLREQVSPWGGAVIAEHVDAPDKVEILRKAGIRYGQGFLLGRPASLADCMANAEAANMPCAEINLAGAR